MTEQSQRKAPHIEHVVVIYGELNCAQNSASDITLDSIFLNLSIYPTQKKNDHIYTQGKV